jgi:hypothetical protein
MGGHLHSDSGSDLPPDKQEWISSVAAAIRTALDDPTVRREIVDLLTGEDERRQRRLQQLATELDGMEITLRLGSDDGEATNDP